MDQAAGAVQTMECASSFPHRQSARGRVSSVLTATLGVVVLFFCLSSSRPLVGFVSAAGGRGRDYEFTLPAASAQSGAWAAGGGGAADHSATALPMTDYSRLSKKQRQQLMASQLAKLQLTTSRLQQQMEQQLKHTDMLREEMQKKTAAPPPQHHVHVHNTAAAPPPQKKGYAKKPSYKGEYYYGKNKYGAGSVKQYGHYQQQQTSSGYVPQPQHQQYPSIASGQSMPQPLFDGTSTHYSAVQPPNAYYKNIAVGEYV